MEKSYNHCQQLLFLLYILDFFNNNQYPQVNGADLIKIITFFNNLNILYIMFLH